MGCGNWFSGWRVGFLRGRLIRFRKGSVRMVIRKRSVLFGVQYGFKREVYTMPEWVIYTVVGLVVGLNLGYIMGIHRGSAIVGELIGGIVDGVSKAIGGGRSGAGG